MVITFKLHTKAVLVGQCVPADDIQRCIAPPGAMHGIRNEDKRRLQKAIVSGDLSQFA